MIHQYKLNGYNIVIDVYSGSVHSVDEVAYDLISLFEENTREQVLEKIVEGKLGKFYENNCLVDMDYIKDDELKVGKYVENTAKELGAENMFVVKANAFLYLRSCPKKFDIVFSDAPYDLEGLEEIVSLVLDGEILKEEGIFIFEHSDKYDFSNHPYFWQLRSYGSVQFSFFKK